MDAHAAMEEIRDILAAEIWSPEMLEWIAEVVAHWEEKTPATAADDGKAAVSCDRNPGTGE